MKLNKKGFTLIELLAVIVILAIILVITIPTVLNSVSTAKQKAFETALTTIEDYIEKQYDSCKLGDSTLAPYEATLLAGNCEKATGADAAVIGLTNYSSDISNLTFTLTTTGKATVTSATGTGQFNGLSK